MAASKASPRFTGETELAVVRELIEGQVTVRLDYRHLPDLDMLMLDIWHELDEDRSIRYGDPEPDQDDPTQIDPVSEPVWQWVKISPCWCGEHGWHWDSHRVTDEQDLLADRPKGKFIAMEWVG